MFISDAARIYIYAFLPFVFPTVHFHSACHAIVFILRVPRGYGNSRLFVFEFVCSSAIGVVWLT